MAAIKIAQLTSQLTLNDTDTVIVETATSTNKMTVGKFKELTREIVDSGNNANGYYTKFADGTMICYKNDGLQIGVCDDLGNGFFRWFNAFSLSFPQTFIYPPAVIFGINIGEYLFYAPRAISTTAFNPNIYLSTNKQGTNANYNLMAIGRWKV